MLLVTGITGLTGRFLYSEIVRNGKAGSLRCLVRKNSDLSWIDGSMPELVYGDANNISDLAEAMKGVSGVIHLVNIRCSPQVIEACKIAGVKRVVFVNTTGMYSKYQAYSGLYRQLEEKIFASGLDYTIIRPTMIYGNQLDKNINKLVRLINRLPVFPVVGDGKSLMQPVYAGDLARVIYQAYKSSRAVGKDYNVAGKEPLSYYEILYQIASALGKKRFFVRIPYRLALIAGKLGDIIPNGLVNLEKIRRLSEDKVFDYSKAKHHLDYNPIPFQEGIKLEIKALRSVGMI
ncbi:MAG: NAD-dependent epimerase/dehydratase family protein [Bacillota bacterium]